MPKLTKKQQKVIDYFGLTYAKSDEPGAGWFVYTKSTKHPYYPGSSCECLDNAVNWYDERLREAYELFSVLLPQEKQVSDKIILACYDILNQKRHFVDVITDAEKTAEDVLNGTCKQPEQIIELKERLRNVRLSFEDYDDCGSRFLGF